MTLDELLADIEAKAKVATPGPWHIGHISENDESADLDGEDSLTIGTIAHRFDQSYIARLDPPTALALVRMVRELIQPLEWYADMEEAEEYEPAHAALARVNALAEELK